MTSPWRWSLSLLLVLSISVNVRSQATIKHDVIFFIDGSLSVTLTNFLGQINAVFDTYIDRWPVSEEGVHVGFIAYSTVLDVVHLTGNVTELTQEADALSYEGRRSNAHLAFTQALTMFMSAHSLRNGSRQTIIMLTDGTARLPLDTRAAAEACRNYGVNIYVVGIGSNVRILESLWYTGDITRVYSTDYYDQLPYIDIGLPVVVAPSVTEMFSTSSVISSSFSISTPTISGVSLGQTVTTSVLTTRLEPTQTTSIGVQSTQTLNTVQSTQTVNTGVQSTQTVNTGVQSTQTVNTGVQTTQTVNTGVQSTQTVNTGVQSTQTVKTGVQSTQTVNTGVQSTQTVNTGVQSTQTVNTGVQSTRATSTLIQPTQTTNAGIQSTQTINAGVQSTQTINTGVQSTQTVNTGVQSTQTVNTGVQSTQTVNTGVQSTQTVNTGVKSTQTVNTGVQSTQTINIGVQSTQTINTGVQSTQTINTGVQSTQTINTGVQSTRATSTLTQPTQTTSRGPSVTQLLSTSSSINVISTTVATQVSQSTSYIRNNTATPSATFIQPTSSINSLTATASTASIRPTPFINNSNNPTTTSIQPSPSSTWVNYPTTLVPTQSIQASTSIWSSTTSATPTLLPTIPSSLLTSLLYSQTSSPHLYSPDVPPPTSSLVSTSYPHTTQTYSGYITPSTTFSVTPTASQGGPDDEVEDGTDSFNVTDEGGICPRAIPMYGFKFVPHPNDCDKYIQCYLSHDRKITASVRACPRGLFWNQGKSECDKPWETCNRQCRDPCRGKDDGDTYKMEGGCGLFWECVDGVARGRSCRPGYAFIPGHGCVYRPDCRYIDIRKRRCDVTCDLRPNDDNTKFIIPLATGWLNSTCLFGTTFDLASCLCRPKEYFDIDCPYLVRLEGTSDNHNDTSDNNETSVVPTESTCQSSVMINQRSKRPLAIQFRYRYSRDDDSDGFNMTSRSQAQVLVRSRECQKGGTAYLVDDGSNLSFEIISSDGIFVSSSVPLLGLNRAAWRDVRVVYSKGEITMEISVGQLTYTSFIKGDPHVQVGVCGWEVGKAGDWEEYDDFKGDIQQVQISRCFEYGV